LFGLNEHLGSIPSYKMLRGNTSGSVLNSTRVLNKFVVKRAVTYKGDGSRDLGVFDVHYIRRRKSRFGRAVYGPIRKR
jgi:hypothetical protein